VILADTAIWLDHFRGRCPEMRDLLAQGQIVTHPYVIAELALGSLRNRAATLADLDRLVGVRIAYLSESRSMIEFHSLYSRGIGLTDAHLVASCLMTIGTQLWTRDKALAAVATSLGIHADLP
jgi:predicted nucleic acid-binding protein